MMHLSVTSRKFTQVNHSQKMCFKIFFFTELESFQNLFPSELLISQNPSRRFAVRHQNHSASLLFLFLVPRVALRVAQPPRVLNLPRGHRHAWSTVATNPADCPSLPSLNLSLSLNSSLYGSGTSGDNDLLVCVI